ASQPASSRAALQQGEQLQKTAHGCVTKIKSMGQLSRSKVVRTYSFRLLIREDASLSTSCEITVHFERVPGTSLVRIHPVFTWMQDKEERERKNQHCEGISKCTSTTILLGPYHPHHRLLFYVFLRKIGVDAI
uniref:Uncharacterized protein n=1 Tax=Phasianus colchicus TaxID=9054 RepID=A0A669QDC4_PHACC